MRIKLSTIVAISYLASSLASVAQNPPLSTTFTNPTPQASDVFGQNSVAAVGTDRVLIGAINDNTGASQAGAAYLFSIGGALLTTFTNPAPQAADHFGWALAAVGHDRVLIGNPGDNAGSRDSAGSAYLFNTNGSLLTIFTNPTPVSFEGFGSAVAALGHDRVLIGNGSGVGEVNLYTTAGTWLVTITNHNPTGGTFGWSLAAMGNDRVLVGAYGAYLNGVNSGAVYVFSTNGTLLNTITNPTPAGSDFFGYAVAAFGNDRVLIGAYSDDTEASGAGAAYLLNTNGTLLTTLTNPTPAVNDFFGYAVAAAGSDRLLIGAYSDDTGAPGAGAVYVFNTNGTLLNTITNPTPADFDSFGESVAWVGDDRVLIGAYSDNTGADSTGAAYLFNLAPAPPPSLTILSAGVDQATISWTPNSSDYRLQESMVLSPPDWTNSPSGATNPVSVPTTQPAKFYRLLKL